MICNVDVELICKAVADAKGVDASWFTTNEKNWKSQNRVHYRSIAIALCRRHTAYSWEEIAEFFGYADHTGVMHQGRKAEENDRADLESIGETIKALLKKKNATSNVSAIRKVGLR